MGKWTPAYSDSVLGARFKTLVGTAIDKHRAVWETNMSTALPLQYDDFAAALDDSDTLTQAIIDILVREYAERRARSTSVQGHYVMAARTANSLQELTEAATVYGDYRARTTFPAHPSSTDLFFASSPPPRHDWDSVDNINDVMVDMDPPPSSHHAPALSSSNAQPHVHEEGSELGARLPNSLYEAFYPPRRTSVFDLSDDDDRSETATILPRVVRRRRSLFGTLPASAASTSASISAGGLTRQPSIRRPGGRSLSTRMSDFSDFTARRRLSNRAGALPEPSASGASDSTSDGPGFGDAGAASGNGTGSGGWHELTLRARALARANASRSQPLGLDGPDGEDAETMLAHRPSYTHRRSATLFTGNSSASSSSTNNTSTAATLWQSALAANSAPSLSLPSPAASSASPLAPRIARLRRGGLPPSETLPGALGIATESTSSQGAIDDGASSTSGAVDQLLEWAARNGAPGEGSVSADEAITVEGGSQRPEETQPTSGPPQLPTPRSVTPEESTTAPTTTEGSSASL